MKAGDRVLPKNKVLGGSNTVWEFLLWERGWNDLPDDKKVGVILPVTDKRKWDHVVRFESCDVDAVVFPDEIVLANG